MERDHDRLIPKADRWTVSCIIEHQLHLSDIVIKQQMHPETYISLTGLGGIHGEIKTT